MRKPKLCVLLSALTIIFLSLCYFFYLVDFIHIRTLDVNSLKKSWEDAVYQGGENSAG